MTHPGWHEDSQAPQQRHWDGGRWAEQATSRAQASRWTWFVAMLLAVGMLIGMLTFWPRGAHPWEASPTDTRTGRPTGKQWNELLPSKTPSATAQRTGFGAPIQCPFTGEPERSEVRDHRLHGGGLSIQVPSGASWRTVPASISWMRDSNSVIRDIAPGWISNVGVGSIRVSDGFSKNIATAAEQFISCMSSSGMFTGFTKREILTNEEYKVSDEVGWRLTSNVFVSGREEHNIRGDVVDIILVPTDDPDRFSVYVSCTTIGHTENAAEVETSLKSLRIDK